MGYRPNFKNSDKTVSYYGTKHYGYSFEWAEEGKGYPSVQYLYNIGKIGDGTLFEYGITNEMTLTAEQFSTWMCLYAKEWDAIKDEYPDWRGKTLLTEPEIVALLDDPGDKTVQWD